MDLRSVSIKKRLYVSFGMCIFFVVLICVISFAGLGNVSSRTNEIMKVVYEKTILSQKIINAVHSVYNSLAIIASEKDSGALNREKENVTAKTKMYKEELDKLEKLETIDKGKAIIGKYKGLLEKAQAINNQIIDLVAGGNSTEASQKYLNEAVPASKELIGAMDEMVQHQDQGLKASLEGIMDSASGAKLFLLVCGFISMAIGTVAAFLITRSILRPIGRIAYLTSKFANGDLAVDLGGATKDEFNVVKDALISLKKQWRTVVTDMKSAANQISSAAQEMNSSAKHMSTGSSEQANRSSQVATASEEMSQTILDIAQNVNNIAKSASNTVVVAKEGDQIVTKSVQKVKEIARIVDDSGRFVKSLGERSKQIGDIVNVINEIADQTNLLALNAAIEAARAGDQGRGFAVVADEVRKLAERTAHSTSEIGQMIKAIQDEVSMAVNSMENATSNVNLGVDLVTRAGSALQDIVVSANELQVMVQEIASATEEMSATSEEISKDIEQIASISKNTCASAENVASSSIKLSDLSETMEIAVSEFKL
ncbi:MAG: methyl-accepting chemotaxis protein [Proteobacteria bacterium]|nr:methyl-accepting chemotaxis protein [Pseudomonadota bacterium]